MKCADRVSNSPETDHRLVRTLHVRSVAFLLLLWSVPSGADDAIEKKYAYSLPWLMRPAAAPTVLRLDTMLAPSKDDLTGVLRLFGGFSPWTGVGFYATAVGVVDSPNQQATNAALSNVGLASLLSPKLPDPMRLSIFIGVTLPTGTGRDDNTSGGWRTIRAGAPARMAMDNSLFSPNHLAFATGADFALVRGGATLQLEATLFQQVRVSNSLEEPDDARTNLTMGVHAGFRIGPITPSVELHHQVFLTTPAVVARNSEARDQTSVGAGVRANLHASHVVLRPGLAAFVAIDEPLLSRSFTYFMLDMPVVF